MGLPWLGKDQASVRPAAQVGVCLHYQRASAVVWADNRVQAWFQSEVGGNATEALSQWLKTQPPRLPLVVTLDPEVYELQLVEAPPVDDAELADALRFRLRDLLPADAAERNVIQAFRLPADAYRGRLDMVFAAIAQRAALRSLVDWCFKQSQRLRQITVPELALLHVVAELAPETAVAVLRLDDDDGMIFLYASGALYLTRRIGTGLRALGVGVPPGAGMSLSNEAPLEALALDIQRSLDYFDSQQGMGLIGQVWVLPPEQPGLDDLLPALEKNLNVPLRLLHCSDWAAADMPLNAGLLTAIGGALSHELDR